MTLLHIPDMTCGHCKAAIETALSPLSTARVFDMEKRELSLESNLPASALIAALDEIGFPASKISE